MLIALVLNLAFAVVLVGGWALAVWALYKGLAPPAAGRDLPYQPATGHHPDPVPIKRAA